MPVIPAGTQKTLFWKEGGFLFSSRGLSPISAILSITAILPISASSQLDDDADREDAPQFGTWTELLNSKVISQWSRKILSIF